VAFATGTVAGRSDNRRAGRNIPGRRRLELLTGNEPSGLSPVDRKGRDHEMYIRLTWVMEGSMTGAVDSYTAWTSGPTLHLLASVEDQPDLKERRRRPKAELTAALRFIEWMEHLSTYPLRTMSPWGGSLAFEIGRWCPLCGSDGYANNGWAMHIDVDGLTDDETATVLDRIVGPCDEHTDRSVALDLHGGWLLTRGRWMPAAKARIRRGGRTLGPGREVSGVVLRGAALDGAVLTGAEFSDTVLAGARLVEADLDGASIDADLRGADLQHANLAGATLGHDLRGADLSGCDLREADLGSADLRGADLTGARMAGARLEGADLRGADLDGADLTGADLSDTERAGVALGTAILDGVVGLDAPAAAEQHTRTASP